MIRTHAGSCSEAAVEIERLRVALRKAREWMFCGEDEMSERVDQYHRDLIFVHDCLRPAASSPDSVGTDVEPPDVPGGIQK